MTGHRHQILAATSILLGLPVAVPAQAASLTQVSRSTWAGSASLPSYVQMYIYVPDKLATKPPIVVSAHSCGNSASGQFGSVKTTQAAADKNGFILIFPDNPGQNCWDVGSTKALTHDGGGDTHGVAQMVRYALEKYDADATRVYIFGGSSGGMMTQAMLAVYPDIFKAGAARAGVPAGCWADGYDSGQQWSGNCAGGRTTKTAQAWGDMVRKMYPSYTGHRPRVQLFHGESDSTISYNNMGEAIKEWTNVLGLSDTPTSTDSYKTSAYTYNRKLWKNDCYQVLEAWSAPGQGHSMSYEETDILKFFGLDQAVGGPDPEDAACSGSGGTGGAGGGGGAAGSGGAAGTSGGRDGGPVGRDAASDVATNGSGGAPGSGGRAGSGGTIGTGGSSATTGTGGDNTTGGATGSGGAVETGGTPGSGGAAGGSGGAGTGGISGTGGTSTAAQGGTSGANSSSGGCNLGVVRGSAGTVSTLLLTLLGLALLRRRRRAG